jgi:hypothetical protein
LLSWKEFAHGPAVHVHDHVHVHVNDYVNVDVDVVVDVVVNVNGFFCLRLCRALRIRGIAKKSMS